MEALRDFEGLPMEIEWLTNGTQWIRPTIDSKAFKGFILSKEFNGCPQDFNGLAKDFEGFA